MENSELGMQNTKCKMQNAKCRMLNFDLNKHSALQKSSARKYVFCAVLNDGYASSILHFAFSIAQNRCVKARLQCGAERRTLLGNSAFCITHMTSFERTGR